MKDYSNHFRELVERQLPDDPGFWSPARAAQDMMILATWRLSAMRCRPNKRSRMIRIVISQEALKDYAHGSDGVRLASDERLVAWLKRQLSAFDPTTCAARRGTGPGHVAGGHAHFERLNSAHARRTGAKDAGRHLFTACRAAGAGRHPAAGSRRVCSCSMRCADASQRQDCMMQGRSNCAPSRRRPATSRSFAIGEAICWFSRAWSAQGFDPTGVIVARGLWDRP